MSAFYKEPGVDDPDFRLSPGQTYAESVMERYKVNNENVEMKSADRPIIDRYIARHAHKLVRYIEENAIPSAIRTYKKDFKDRPYGNVRYEVNKNVMTLCIRTNLKEYVLTTENFVYNLSGDIQQTVADVFAKVPGIKVEALQHNIYYTTNRFLRMEISLEGL